MKLSSQQYQIIQILHEKQISFYIMLTWSIFWRSITQNRLKKAIGSTILHNTIGFVRETNWPFALWSRDPFFESQWSKNSAIGSIANIDQHEIFFPLTPNLIGFVRKMFTYDVMVTWLTSKRCTRWFSNLDMLGSGKVLDG